MSTAPTAKQLFQRLCQFDRIELPVIRREIENLGSIFNAKDRLNELCSVISYLVRYVVMTDAERHDININDLITLSQHQQNHGVATQPSTAFPASGAIAFPQQAPQPASQPATTPPALDVMVGAPISPPAGVLGVPLDAPDPEPSNVIQTVITRNGSTKVIPPVGSRAPVRTFAPGQPVDTTYIAIADSAPTGDGAQSPL